MTVDMSYQVNFLNGLQSGNVVVSYLRPPLFKQGMNWQSYVDLTTTTPNTQQETGTKCQNSEGNTNRNKQRKTNGMKCAIPEEQKELVEKCYKAATA